MKNSKASRVALTRLSASSIVWLLVFAGVARADQPPPPPEPRGPLGIYALVVLEKAIEAAQKKASYPLECYDPTTDPQLPPYPNPDSLCSPDPAEPILIDYLTSLLANPAVSGLSIRVYWSTLNPPSVLDPTLGVPSWTALDDVFKAVHKWNLHNTYKTIQLVVVPGFYSPSWVFTLPGMTSCDPLFAPFSVPPVPRPAQDCGYATFTNSEGSAGDVATPLPLPWSEIYKNAWHDFLVALNEHIDTENDPGEFVSIAIAGPTSSSVEMRLPSLPKDPLGYKWNSDTSGGKTNDGLLGNFYGKKNVTYQNTDQAFIDEWKNAIDMYSGIFSGITLIVTTGNGLPNFNVDLVPSPLTPVAPPPITAGFEPDCSTAKTNNLMDCYAEAHILAHLAKPSVGGFNAKATQTSGVIARRTKGGHLGQVGVKWLDAVTADGETNLPGSSTEVSRMFGGIQFDTSFSDANHMQHEGCQHKSEHCHNLTPEQGLFNVLQTVFTGTAAGKYYGEPTILTPPGKTAPFNYLQIYDDDIVYATNNSQCTPPPGLLCTTRKIRDHVMHTGVVGTMTAQDELVKASQQILNKVSEPIVLSPAVP